MSNKRKRGFLKLFGKKRCKKEQDQTKKEQINVTEDPITEKVEQPITENERKPIGENVHNENSPIKIRHVPFKCTIDWYKKVQYSFLDEDDWHDIKFNVVYGYSFLTINVYSDYKEFEDLKKRLKTYKDILELIKEEDARHQKLIEEDAERKKRSKETGY